MDYDGLSREELIARLKAQETVQAPGARPGGAAELERVVHELQVHQIELEAQNQALREAEGQIEESRGQYVDLYDFAPIAYCTLDRDGVVLRINLTGASMLGKDRSRIIGRPFVSLVKLDHPDGFVRHIRDSLDAAIPLMSEATFSTERGPMEVQLLSAAVRNARGVPTSCRTAILDITQRRSAEREARAAHGQERVLRGRIEAIDRASGAVSAALTRLSGPDIGEFLQVIVDQARELAHARYAALGIGGGEGRPFAPWVFSGMSAEQAAAIGRVPRGVGLLGAVLHSGRPIRLRDLRERSPFSGFPPHHPPMESFLGVPIRYEGQNRGNLYLANKEGADEFSEEDQTVMEMLAERTGVAMEVARLRQFEAREHIRLEFLAKAGPLLAESIEYEPTLKAIARLLVPGAADVSAIDLLQPGGAMKKVAVYHRQHAKRQLLDRLLGTTPYDAVPEDVRAAIETARPQRRDVAPGFMGGGVSQPELSEIAGAIGATCAILAPLILRGRVVGVLRLAMAESGRKYTDDDLSLAQEIAHHAALAIERARLHRLAQDAIAARDNLLAVVSHDLRNYLSAIRLGAEMLSRPGPTGERQAGAKQAETIKRSATRMAQLIDSLRDATMIETGHFTITPQAEDVGGLVEEAFKTLEPQAESKSLQLSIEVEAQLSTVFCDRERVLQVIANLVGNAIKFTGKGGEIRIAAKRSGDLLCCSISDTGTGIPEQQLAHVFERYWKGHPDTREGTGLGLCIAKGIVEVHGGTIWVESTVGVGSTFLFTLPLAPSGGQPPRPREGTEETSSRPFAAGPAASSPAS
jgi:PAS domain S-box-containing protein